ncbi:MAG: hypothetical protein AB7O21_06765 [Gammaproteobacteria bacterium]
MAAMLEVPRPRTRASPLFIVAMGVSAVVVVVAARIFPALADENHTLENLQVALLLCAAAGQVWRAERIRGEQEYQRTLAVLLAFLCLACALRELDIDRLGARAFFEPFETTLRALTLGSIATYVYTRFRAVLLLLREPRATLQDPVGRLTIAGVVLYCLSWPLDKKLAPLGERASLLLEEWLELWACASFFLAACVRPRTGG